MTIAIVDRHHDREALAEAVLRDLPDWFGIEEAILGYVVAAGRMPMLAAEADGGAIGFASLERATPAAMDVHAIGVLRAWHGRGAGRALIEATAARARAEGCRLLTVKTLSAAHPDPFYAATRRFYEAQGFVPVAELPALWGPDNPCLLMARVLTP